MYFDLCSIVLDMVFCTTSLFMLVMLHPITVCGTNDMFASFAAHYWVIGSSPVNTMCLFFLDLTPFCTRLSFPTKVIYRCVSGFATGCPCDVWCRESTTCHLVLVHV